MSFKEAIRSAAAEREQQSNKDVNVASNKASKPQTIEDELAGLTVRVSKRHRLHWLIEAKKEGTSLTAAITEALNARFGEPENE